MKKAYFIAAFIGCLLVASSIATVNGASTEKFSLDAVGTDIASGVASWRMYERDGLNYAELRMQVKYLDELAEDGYIYEIWAVDEETDYKLSLGTLTPTMIGHKRWYEFDQSMPNPGIYDMIVVTKEPRNDINPMPGEAVLSGEIPHALGTDIPMSSLMKGRYQVPLAHSSGEGMGSFMVDTENNIVHYEIMHRDMRGVQTAAHIHGFASKDENSGVLHNIGTGDFVSGQWNYNEADEAMILAGQTYVNIHSSEYLDGELRGQILYHVG